MSKENENAPENSPENEVKKEEVKIEVENVVEAREDEEARNWRNRQKKMI